MSGFFKKMFNRLAGKTATAQPEAAQPESGHPEHGRPPVKDRFEAVSAAAPVEPAPMPDVAKVANLLVEEPTFVGDAQKTPPKERVKPAPQKPHGKGAAKKSEPKAKPDPHAKTDKAATKARKAALPRAVAEKAAVATPKARPEKETLEKKEALEKTVVVAPPPVSLPQVGRLAPRPAPAPEAAPQSAESRKSWLARLNLGLSKSSQTITSSITTIFTKKKLDAATLQDLEDVLIQADLGLTVSERIIAEVSRGRHDREINSDEVRHILASEVEKVLKDVEVPFHFGTEKPFVVLVVGVNGAGKTTTIGKLGAIAKSEGLKVMFAACDTFRAAAIEQLTVWGERIGATTLSRATGADSSGLAYDAMVAAAENDTDILFIDTAGRLQNKMHLMEELEKIVRVIKKRDDTAPHAVLLVLDATTGQNAIAQAEVFTRVAGVTGLVMTKLDGTARGGILVAIAEKFKLPIHAIGVGESVEDLQPFEAHAFAKTIAGLEIK